MDEAGPRGHSSPRVHFLVERVCLRARSHILGQLKRIRSRYIRFAVAYGNMSEDARRELPRSRRFCGMFVQQYIVSGLTAGALKE